VIDFIIRSAKRLLLKNLSHIEMDQRDEKTSSMPSEALIAILITDIVHQRRSQRGEPITLKGEKPRRHNHVRQLIKHIGLEREIGDNHTSDANDDHHENGVHVFRFDNRYKESSTIKGDRKIDATVECVSFLNSCVTVRGLQLTESAKARIKACLGEVLDNVEEHCGRGKPVWYIRGYFYDIKEKGSLELSVFNIGNSFYENFNKLSDSSEIKKTVWNNYVTLHEDSVDPKSLFTVAALQGSISTKRDEDDTRGQGTVTLIETFEKMFDDYISIKGESSNPLGAQMNIISGQTIIKFDGNSRSTLKTTKHNGEVFTMAFNSSNSLKDKPDSKYVISMRDSVFPGVMVNIRIPLEGNSVTLQG